MRVLIGCEESATVREEFKALGHDAWSCDIEPTRIPGNHYQCDVRELFNQHWDLFIVFPPCTHLAVSGAPHFEAKRKDGRQKEAIDFFLDMVHAPVDRIAVENPIGIMSSLYRTPDQIIQPYYFGDAEPKSTCLWLKNLPLLRTTNYVEPEYLIYKSSSKKQGYSRYSSFWGLPPKDRAKIRSKTFQGIAQAMANQWSKAETYPIQQRLFSYA